MEFTTSTQSGLTSRLQHRDFFADQACNICVYKVKSLAKSQINCCSTSTSDSARNKCFKPF